MKTCDLDRLKPSPNALLCILSILLVSLSFPGMPAPWLAGVAMAPLFIAADNAKNCAPVLGLWAFTWWCWSIHWILPATINFIGISAILAGILWLLFCAFLSLPYWIIGYFWHRICITQSFFLNTALQTLLFTVFASSTQWLIPANPAHSLYIYPQIIQVVDIGGIPLLLFGLVAVNISLAKAIQNKASIAMLCGAGLIVLLFFVYSHIRIVQFDAQKSVNRISIGILQPNLQRQDAVDPLFHLTERLTTHNTGIDLIAWPEIPPAFSWQENKNDRDNIKALIEKTKKPILLNSGYIYQNDPSGEDNPRSYYNAAQLLSSDAELLGSYHKQILVPLFEYLPFEKSFPLIRHWFPDALRYISGDKFSPLIFGNTHIAPLICFEMLFPHYVRQQTNKGAHIIINLSNDSWFQTSKGSINHFSLAIFRSVENKIPWVRVSNGGISASVSGTGRINPSSLTNLDESRAQVVRVDIKETQTFYQQFGDLFLIIASFIVMGALGYRSFSFYKAIISKKALS